MKKVLVYPSYLKIIAPMLKKRGLQPVSLKDQDPRAVLKRVPDVSAILLMNAPVTSDEMSRLSNLKIVARLGVGYDSVDLKGADDHDVWVTNTPGGNEKSVAENTVADILVLSHRLFTTSSVMRGEQPIANYQPKLLSGKTVGIVGFGHIARHVIKMLSGFGVRILIWDRHPKTSRYGKFVDWNTLFKESDFVSLHIPATPDTKHCVNAKTFRVMKKSAFIVNFGRGDLINQTDMVNALKAHEIKGAGLDVYEKEPLPQQSELRQLPNVFITPHCAGMTIESHRKIAEMTVNDVARVLSGKRPDHSVNHPNHK